MNFEPHHGFTACSRLERKVDTLRAATNVSNQCYDAYAKYHFSLLHKLQSARYHVDTLKSYLSSQNAQQLDPHLVVYRVNFHFDGFLHVLGSALDILAREIISYYGPLPPGNIYHHTAFQFLTANKPGDALLPLLAQPAWKQEFGDYRNTATHESLIGTSYTVSVEVVGKNAIKRIVFPIPDDPRAPVLTFQRNKDIVEYCERTFKRVLSHVNQLYNHIEQRATAANALPL